MDPHARGWECRHVPHAIAFPPRIGGAAEGAWIADLVDPPDTRPSAQIPYGRRPMKHTLLAHDRDCARAQPFAAIGAKACL
jgi:hypothetical protein